jgi:hypothetical protein
VETGRPMLDQGLFGGLISCSATAINGEFLPILVKSSNLFYASMFS